MRNLENIAYKLYAVRLYLNTKNRFWYIHSPKDFFRNDDLVALNSVSVGVDGTST